MSVRALFARSDVVVRHVTGHSPGVRFDARTRSRQRALAPVLQAPLPPPPGAASLPGAVAGTPRGGTR